MESKTIIIAIVIGVLLVSVLLILLIKQTTGRNDIRYYRNTRGQAMGTGIGIGVAVGAALGILMGILMDNIALGIAIGPGMGVAIGTAIGASVQKQEGEKNEVSEQPVKRQAIFIIIGLMIAVFCAGLIILLITRK